MFYFALAVAGGMGVLLRFLLWRVATNLQWTALPFATLAANIIGSFLIGYLSWSLVHRWPVSAEVQIVVLTGFLGGFTTFSAFSLEVINLIENGLIGRAALYGLTSVVLCLIMCFLGLMLARQ